MTSAKTNRVSQFLFHPFVRVAGAASLALGLAAILLAGLIGAGQGLHFDGVLDAHVGLKLPVWFSVAEGLLDWFSLAVVLHIVGRIISRTAFRAVDLLGTQALARWPTVIVSLVCLLPGFHRFSDQLLKSAQKMAFEPTKLALPPLGMDGAVFGLVTLIMLVCTLWMVMLMWKSFSHCCNVRGGKAVAGFVVGLLIAEVLSKLGLGQLLKFL